MTSPHEPTGQPTEILVGAPEPVRGRSRTKVAVATAAALVTVGVAGGAVWLATQLGGGGSQPEDVLPREAIGFVKVDLDPSAGQKVAAYDLAKKFPDSGVTSQESVQDDVLHAVLDGKDEADYDKHVRPWLGRRAGVAFLAPGAAEPDEPRVVAAVQVTDRGKAEAGLRALAAEEPLHFAFAEGDDYVLLSDDKAVVDSAAGGTEHLADDPRFDEGIEALDGDQIALGWMDVAAVWRAVPAEDKKELTGGELEVDPSGLVVFGAHVADGTVEVVGRTVDFSLGSDPKAQALLRNPLGTQRPTGLIKTMPGDSLFAVGATGLGDGLAGLYDAFAGELEKDAEFQEGLRTFGVRLPDDLRAVFGQEAALTFGGDPDAPRLGVRVRTGDTARGVELVKKGQQQLAELEPQEANELEVTEVEGGYAVGFGLGDVGRTLTTGTLGESPVFRRTVPDVDSSGLTYYMDVAGFVKTFEPSDGDLSDKGRRNLEPLQAFGYTSTSDGQGDGTIRLRVTVKE